MQDRTSTQKYTLLDFIRIIILNEIEIDEDRVNIFNEKFTLPTYEGLFIVIESKWMKVIGNRNTAEDVSGTMTEKQELITRENVAIGLFSRNREAEQIIPYVIMALNSVYSQQTQEKYSFKIYRNPTVENLSAVEGSAMLNRFEIGLMGIAWYEKTKSADYYDTFNAEISTENETVAIENIEEGV